MTDDMSISGDGRQGLPPLRAYVAAGVGAVVVGLGVMALMAFMAGVSAGAIGGDSDFVNVVILRGLVPALCIVLGVVAGRATARRIMSADW